MNPFSSRYYLKLNLKKVLTIIIMISMISMIYVGGLYLTNIKEEAIAIRNELQDFVTIWSTFDDTNGEQIKELEQRMIHDDTIEVFQVSWNFFLYKTMLGFQNGDRAYAFTKEEFIRFNDRVQLLPTQVEITNNTVILSEKQADYMKLKNRGELTPENSAAIDVYYGEYPFQVLTYNSDAFHVYFVTEDAKNSGAYLVTWKEGLSKDVFYQRIKEIKAQYDKLEVVTYEDQIHNINESFEINYIIYYSIIAIVSIVFAITTNAVFVGLYDRRKQEFALYQGIGIPKIKIYKKIMAEIVSMNVIGLLIGALICILTVSILNEFVYHKDGLSMWYFHPTAFFATLFCDLAILVPGIGLRIRRTSKEMKEVSFL